MGITREQAEELRRRNPKLFGFVELAKQSVGPVGGEKPQNLGRGADSKRVRQDKPLNKGEIEFGEILKRRFPRFELDYEIRPQPMRLPVASGAWWKPDWAVFEPCSHAKFYAVTFYEVKGPKAARWSRRGEFTIKVAARAWPMFRFVLAWRESGVWREQEIVA